MIMINHTFIGADFTSQFDALRQVLITGSQFVEIEFVNSSLNEDDSKRVFPINLYEIDVDGKLIQGQFNLSNDKIATFNATIPDGKHKIRFLPQSGWREESGIIYNVNDVGFKFNSHNIILYNGLVNIGSHNWTTPNNNFMIIADDINFYIHHEYSDNHLVYYFTNLIDLYISSCIGSTSTLNFNESAIKLTLSNNSTSTATRKSLGLGNHGFYIVENQNEDIGASQVSFDGRIHPFEYSLLKSVPSNITNIISTGRWYIENNGVYFILLRVYDSTNPVGCGCVLRLAND